MKKFGSVREIEDELVRYAPSQLHSSTFEIGRVRALMKHLGDPQNTLRVIHIAGTSGKTSTAYYIRSLLEATGAKVGLTVSPHIETLRERIQVEGGPIGEEKFIMYFNEFYPLVKGFVPEPTFFELVTAFAYWVGVREDVDYFVAETGLGGRLDATNVVERADKVCVLTPVGYDHTDILGETLAEIATEKAGIIGRGNDVFCAAQAPEAMRVFENGIKDKNATLHRASRVGSSGAALPAYQQQNFALARDVVEFICHRDHLAAIQNVDEIAQSVQVPGRWETYKIGDKDVLLDGAHNPQKLEALLSALREKNISPAAMVVAFSDAPEKKVRECVRLIMDFATQVVFTEFQLQRDVFRRSVSIETLQKMAKANFEKSPQKAFEQALASSEPYIIVTGSLYLVATLRPVIQRAAASAREPSLLH